MIQINFFSEEVDFRIKNRSKLRNWITTVIKTHNKAPHCINFIFVNDEYLLGINQQYLQHKTFTDIITFDQSSDISKIEGDIFISIERVKENADHLNIELKDELNRVMIHGILHLLGYKDKTPEQKEEMRKKENHYLALRKNF